MHRQNASGFSVRELVIVLAVLAGLAGFLAPMTSRRESDAGRVTARCEMNRIASAMNIYIHDTLYYPTGSRGATTYHYLYSDGPLPENGWTASGPGIPLREILDSGDYGGPGWQGPYLGPLASDPWGHAYVVNVHGYFFGGERVAIFSAGPDGRLETPLTALEPAGDDLLLVLER